LTHTVSPLICSVLPGISTKPPSEYNVEVPAYSLPATRKTVAAFRKHFKCQRCGACCNVFEGVKISKGEIKRLAVPQHEWCATFRQFARSTYLKQPCRYYDNADGKCTIYNIRPRTCREFPTRIEEGPKSARRIIVSENCPAALKALAEVETERTGRTGR
jgi:Fe-S-cluster containining protein